MTLFLVRWGHHVLQTPHKTYGGMLCHVLLSPSIGWKLFCPWNSRMVYVDQKMPPASTDMVVGGKWVNYPNKMHKREPLFSFLTLLLLNRTVKTDILYISCLCFVIFTPFWLQRCRHRNYICYDTLSLLSFFLWASRFLFITLKTSLKVTHPLRTHIFLGPGADSEVFFPLIYLILFWWFSNGVATSAPFWHCSLFIFHGGHISAVCTAWNPPTCVLWLVVVQ